MISIWVFIVLGIAQGVLEWLPVSSEGQIILLGTLFGIENSNLILSIAFWLHLGTLISVIIYYRQEWKTVLNIQDKDGDFLRKFIIITSIFTGIVGLPIKYLLTNSLNNENFGNLIMLILGISLIFTSLLLRSRKYFHNKNKNLEEITFFQMAIVGLSQGITIIPGVSRSGTTITALLLVNIDSEEAFKGSFILAVPAIMGAIVLDLFDLIFMENSVSALVEEPTGIIIGIIFSAVFGLITMKYLIKIANNFDYAKHDIKNLAKVVADQIEIYLKSNPEKTAPALLL